MKVHRVTGPGESVRSEKWVRQIGILAKVFLKRCLFVAGGFRVDKRTYIWRGVFAHNGQRLTIFISELIMKKAEGEGCG